MSFIDIEESRVWPSAADEAGVAHEDVRKAAVVGIWGARRRGSSMGSVRGRSGRETPVLAQEASEVVMVT
jgi:hypothetical protein